MKTSVIALVGQGVGSMRVHRALRELQLVTGQRFWSLAVLEPAQRGSWMDRHADEVLELPEGVRSTDVEQVAELLSARGIDMLVPGSAPTEPRLRWAEAAQARGWAHIGPSARCLRRLLDPLEVRKTAEKAGVRTIPWSGEAVSSASAAAAHAERLGYPVLCRSSGALQAGLGIARGPEELPEVFAAAAAAAGQTKDGVILERLLTGVRRLEVPVVSAPDGRRWALDVIDASLRRRDGSVMIEAPASGLAAGVADELRRLALELASAFEHEQLGTLVFLYDPKSEVIFFLGYDFGRGGEHAAAEVLRGIDLAKLRVRIALGQAPEPPPPPRGAAFVAHLRVEGEGPIRLEHLRPATGPGVRTDLAAAAGDRLVPGASVAELITWGSDRREALVRMQRALAGSALLVEGGESSVTVLARLLAEPAIQDGPVEVDWLVERLRSPGFRARSRAAEALVEVAIEVYEQEQAAEREAFFASARRGRPEARPGVARPVELEYDGERYEFSVAALGPDRFSVSGPAGTVLARIEHRRASDHVLVIGDSRLRVASGRSGREHRVVVAGEPHSVHRSAGVVVRAGFPAIVAGFDVEPGQAVEAGQVVARLESMKMELGVVSPTSGFVRRLLALPSTQVGPGEPLVWVDPERPRTAGTPGEAGSDRVDFSALVGASPAPDPLDRLESFVRGFDVELADMQAALRVMGAETEGDFGREALVLEAFLNLIELSPLSNELEASGDGGLRLSPGEYLRAYLMNVEEQGRGLPPRFLGRLGEALAGYGVDGLEPKPALFEALCRLQMAMARRGDIVLAMLSLLGRQAGAGASPSVAADSPYRGLIDRLVVLTQASLPEVCEAARAVRYRLFDGPFLATVRAEGYSVAEQAAQELAQGRSEDALERLLECPLSLSNLLLRPERSSDRAIQRIHLEVLSRRYYRLRGLDSFEIIPETAVPIARASYEDGDRTRTLLGVLGSLEALPAAGPALAAAAASASGPVGVDLYTWRDDSGNVEASLPALVAQLKLPGAVDRVVVTIGPGSAGGPSSGSSPCVTFRRSADGFVTDPLFGDLHPMVAERLELGRLENFELERVEAPDDVLILVGKGRTQPEDQRVFIHGEIRDLGTVRDADGKVVAMPRLEQVFAEALAGLRRLLAERGAALRTDMHRLELFLRPVISEERRDLIALVRKLAPATVGLGLEQVRINARFADGKGAGERRLLRLSNPSGQAVELHLERPQAEPVAVLSPYEQKVMKLRRRGLTHPHELARMLTPPEATPDIPAGRFEELDFDADGKLVPVDRGPGQNKSNIIVGYMISYTDKHPEGMKRVALFGDPSRAMGSLSEPECRRIIAGLDLAETLKVPLEWYALSAGAEISKDRGTENMDWISAVLRRIIEYTQAGGEVNVVVCGINVGAQPYWNAEATMLMHTKGILVMTPGTAMVLTGKQALDFSGGVSAEDNLGIGGYERIMGPNGQAQYFAEDLRSAGRLLLDYYEHAYRPPGERFPRSRPSTDPRDRDVCLSPHRPVEGSTFRTVGEIFSPNTNPGRKRPFDIREVMRAVADADRDPLERWRDMRDAETVVTWDAHLGGHPVAMLGIESRPIQRVGYVSADGPRMWTAGTLFPQSSKKAARAINAATGNRPLVVLANLSGFDGSPESLRNVQLEFGAEIGRAITNFDGPIVFTVVSRFHGGAFVVFSNKLNDHMEIFALEDTFASVIGGAPAAAVVFARELRSRITADPAVVELEAAMKGAGREDKAHVATRLREARAAAHARHLGDLAYEYDQIHSVQRAQKVGSVHRIIHPSRLRPELIEAVERGHAKFAAR